MPHKILIIDDEPQIRDLLTKFLTKLGYTVSAAESGPQAFPLIKDQPFSLVLCDVQMPEMDGLETLTAIKKLNNSLPVLMMSGFGTHDRIIEALEKGAVDFVAKPINLIQTKNIIHQILNPDIKSPHVPASTMGHLLKESYLGLLRMMIYLLETKDPYIKDHSKRVAEYATQMARSLELSEETIEVINYAGLLHDIGKIGISDLILAKPANLTVPEWGEVQMHPVTGCMIIEQLKFFRAEEPLIRHHHEWYNGAGYPSGLSQEAIPLGARILTIVDAYDAMTSVRPYRKAMERPAAQQIIRDGSGVQFDPKLVEVFLSLLEQKQCGDIL